LWTRVEKGLDAIFTSATQTPIDVIPAGTWNKMGSNLQWELIDFHIEAPMFQLRIPKFVIQGLSFTVAKIQQIILFL
jgi:hypothetical protein